MNREGHLLGANQSCLGDLRRDDYHSLTDYDPGLTSAVLALHQRCNRQVIDTGEPVVGVLEPRPDGSGGQRWLSTSRMPMLDESGAVAGILATYVDVTDSRRTEEALRQSESRFRRAVEAAPTAMLMSDPIGNIIMVNNQAEILFGHERENLLGTSIEGLVPMRARGSHGQLRSDFMRNPVTRRMGSNRDVHAIRSDGTEFPVEIGLGLVETDSGPAVLAAITDITLRKQAQSQLESALREKTVLLNEVHHRVKNNLQVICSLLNLQANASGNRHVRSVLLESHNRVQAMALTHQLLYESKDFSFIDLGEYLQRIASLVTRAMPTSSQHVELVTTLERAKSELPCAIACGLIVNELLTNAFKHAFPNDRSGHIWLEFRAADTRPGMLRVADDGVGLPEAVRDGGDTSLGLQLVPMLAEQAGATMTVLVDGGTEFIFRFEAKNGEGP
jgi:PAS domain S-box-containing protein